jgi:peroxiredoxin
MATLASKLELVTVDFNAQVPAAVSETLGEVVKDAETRFAAPIDVIKVGEAFPSFTLPNAVGTPVSSAELLANGPLLVTFYRGNWCPYCNLALHGLQERLQEIQAQGVQLVAISPELPDSTLSTQEKNELQFPVLSDVGNKLARKLRIVWKQPDSLKPLFQQFGIVSGRLVMQHKMANVLCSRTFKSRTAMTRSKYRCRLRF